MLCLPYSGSWEAFCEKSETSLMAGGDETREPSLLNEEEEAMLEAGSVC